MNKIEVALPILIILSLLFRINLNAQDRVIYQFALEEAQAFAIENSYKSRLASYDLQESELTVKETMSIGFPQIDGDATYNNNIKLPVQVIPAEFLGGQPGEFAEVVFGTQHNVSANISASQLIFDGSYLIGLKGAKVYNQLVAQQKGATDFEVKKNASDAYYTAVVAVENSKMLQANFDEVYKQLTETQALYKNGFVEEQNVQQLELNLGKIEIAVENAKRQVDISRDLLKFQLGIPLRDSIYLVDDLETLVMKAKQEITNRYNYDIKNNVQYKVANAWVEVRETQVRLEKSQFLPSLYLFFNQNWSSFETNFNYFNGEAKWFDATLVGLSLNVPIFSSFRRSSALQKAKVVSERALLEREQLEAGLALDLSIANSNFNQALSSYDISKRNVDVANSILYKTNRKFQEGISTSFEVTQATSQLISDQFDYVDSALRLFEAKTKIDELLNN
jgi:outer membrane protein